MKTYKELQEELNETIIRPPRDHRDLRFPWDKPLRPKCPHPDCPHEREVDPFPPFKPHFKEPLFKKYHYERNLGRT